MSRRFRDIVRARPPRMSTFLVLAVVLAPLVWAYGPEGSGPRNLVLGAWKLWIVSWAAFVGYWIDRALFHYARPEKYETGGLFLLFGVAQLRRAVIVGAVILAAGLAL